MSEFNFVNSLLFPSPESSYNDKSFPQELIWIPRCLNPRDANPEESVPCLLLPSPSARFMVLYLHSNAEDLGKCHSFCSLLRFQFQVHVLAVEYPGYGICPGGQATEEKVIENARLALRFIAEVLKWQMDEVIVFGRSIGCGPALALADGNQFYGVILICPFLSVRELCRDFIGPFADLVDERFPNKDRVSRISSPLLLVHGKMDTVVPWTHGQALFDACKSRKRIVLPAEMSHNTNLHVDASYFVLPMLQFFGLPDYSFDELRVPEWAFDNQMWASCTSRSKDSEQEFDLDSLEECREIRPPTGMPSLNNGLPDWVFDKWMLPHFRLEDQATGSGAKIEVKSGDPQLELKQPPAKKLPDEPFFGMDPPDLPDFPKLSELAECPELPKLALPEAEAEAGIEAPNASEPVILAEPPAAALAVRELPVPPLSLDALQDHLQSGVEPDLPPVAIPRSQDFTLHLSADPTSLSQDDDECCHQSDIGGKLHTSSRRMQLPGSSRPSGSKRSVADRSRARGRGTSQALQRRGAEEASPIALKLLEEAPFSEDPTRLTVRAYEVPSGARFDGDGEVLVRENADVPELVIPEMKDGWHSEDEDSDLEPEPPEDIGFFKVPRSKGLECFLDVAVDLRDGHGPCVLSCSPAQGGAGMADQFSSWLCGASMPTHDAPKSGWPARMHPTATPPPPILPKIDERPAMMPGQAFAASGPLRLVVEPGPSQPLPVE